MDKEQWESRWEKESSCYDIASSVRPLIVDFICSEKSESYREGFTSIEIINKGLLDKQWNKALEAASEAVEKSYPNFEEILYSYDNYPKSDEQAKDIITSAQSLLLSLKRK